MALASSINGVAFLSPQQHGLWRGDPSLLSLSHTRCKIYQRNARTLSCSMDVRAVVVKPDIDFKDPDWKTQYEKEFDKRFSLPHLKDIFDVKPRPTTFSLVSREPLQNGNGAPKDMRYDYVNDDDRALLKVIKFASPTSAGAECIDTDCSWVEQWVHRAGPRKQIYFEPDEVKAAIVTCGGLCPGLNDVIRQVLLQMLLLLEADDRAMHNPR